MSTLADTPGAASAAPGFQPIPARIRELRPLAPLVLEASPRPVRQEIVQTLEDLGRRLAVVHRAAAEAWLDQGLHERALPHLEAAAACAPGELEHHNQLGVVRYLAGDDVGAINAFNDVLQGDAGNGEAWCNLGMVLFGQQEFVQAEDCFRRALEEGPGDAQAWNNRGVCLFQAGRVPEARVCFERALQLDPADTDARHNLQNLP